MASAAVLTAKTLLWCEEIRKHHSSLLRQHNLLVREKDTLQNEHNRFVALVESKFEFIESRAKAMEMRARTVDSGVKDMESRAQGMDMRFRTIESKHEAVESKHKADLAIIRMTVDVANDRVHALETDYNTRREQSRARGHSTQLIQSESMPHDDHGLPRSSSRLPGLTKNVANRDINDLFESRNTGVTSMRPDIQYYTAPRSLLSDLDAPFASPAAPLPTTLSQIKDRGYNTLNSTESPSAGLPILTQHGSDGFAADTRPRAPSGLRYSVGDDEQSFTQTQAPTILVPDSFPETQTRQRSVRSPSARNNIEEAASHLKIEPSEPATRKRRNKRNVGPPTRRSERVAEKKLVEETKPVPGAQDTSVVVERKPISDMSARSIVIHTAQRRIVIVQPTQSAMNHEPLETKVKESCRPRTSMGTLATKRKAQASALNMKASKKTHKA